MPAIGERYVLREPGPYNGQEYILTGFVSSDQQKKWNLPPSEKETAWVYPSRKVSLVNLKDGSVWALPVKVNDYMDITRREFGRITQYNSSFVILKEEEKEIKKANYDSLPEVIPNIRTSFEHPPSLDGKNYVTLCYMYVNKKLRVGSAVCSDKDEYNELTGEKIAFRRAIDQFMLPRRIKIALWENFLYEKKVITTLQADIFYGIAKRKPNKRELIREQLYY